MKKKLLSEIKKAGVQDEKIVHILNGIYELLDKRLPELPTISPIPPISREARKEWIKPIEAYSEKELVTIKEARHILGVSRWKIDKMRDEDELTTLDKNGQVRLIRKEVEEAKVWYSIPKGKV
ncbi:MAG TPA: hypothetical protein VKZ57_10245 [Sphingobacterium sp.]|nr:hypothetical protein [Sphingobacterium sp.]